MKDELKSEKPVIVFKYGGNAMLNKDLEKAVLTNISSLREKGYYVVIVHGGGPFIKNLLAEVNIESEFIDGHRRTTPEALEYVEMALKGKVNSNLTGTINILGHKAVGLSGKDGQMVIAAKRLHQRQTEKGTEEVDLGQVGDVRNVDTTLLKILLNNGYLPVIACLATDEEGNTYNINADMFAGHVAGALKADQFVVLTDVDGLLRDKDDPSTLITEINHKDIQKLTDEGIIKGGMIPKTEACGIALDKGAGSARIINGTVPEQVLSVTDKEATGTLIMK